MDSTSLITNSILVHNVCNFVYPPGPIWARPCSWGPVSVRGGGGVGGWLSQNVWYGGCTEIAQPVVRNFLQRVALSQNSSFTGADNPENITAEPGSSRDKHAGSLCLTT